MEKNFRFADEENRAAMKTPLQIPLIDEKGQEYGPFHWKHVVEWNELELLQSFSTKETKGKTIPVSDLVAKIGIPPSILTRSIFLAPSEDAALAKKEAMDSLHELGFPKSIGVISEELENHIRQRLSMNDEALALEDPDFKMNTPSGFKLGSDTAIKPVNEPKQEVPAVEEKPETESPEVEPEIEQRPLEEIAAAEEVEKEAEPAKEISEPIAKTIPSEIWHTDALFADDEAPDRKTEEVDEEIGPFKEKYTVLIPVAASIAGLILLVLILIIVFYPEDFVSAPSSEAALSPEKAHSDGTSEYASETDKETMLVEPIVAFPTSVSPEELLSDLKSATKELQKISDDEEMKTPQPEPTKDEN